MPINTPQRKPWKNYQEVATHVLNQFAPAFGLNRVEGEQTVKGKLTTRVIDAKGVRDSDGATMVIECRRKRRRLDQEALDAIAFKIQDSGAQGGIVVTPLDLQSGAARIAEGTGIIAVKLNPNCTPTDFVMHFLGKLLVGASSNAGAVAGDSCDAESFRRCQSCGNDFPLVDPDRRLCRQCEAHELGL